MPNLEVLSVGANNFGHEAAAELAVPLRKLPLLRSLYMYGCIIGDEGMASLFG